KEPPIRLVIDDGHPDPRLTPLSILMREYASRIKLAQRSVIIPGSLTAGTQRLRTTLAGYLQSSRGIQAGPEHLIVTHGAQMSIYLAAKTLLRPGDYAIIGDPIYPVAAQVLENTGARIIRIPVDDHGRDGYRCHGKGLQTIPGKAALSHSTPSPSYHRDPESPAPPSTAGPLYAL